MSLKELISVLALVAGISYALSAKAGNCKTIFNPDGSTMICCDNGSAINCF